MLIRYVKNCVTSFVDEPNLNNLFSLQAKMLPGDVLLVASFISYLGCFTKQYRLELFERKWLPYLKKLQKPIPLSLGYIGANVLSLLVCVSTAF